MGQSQSNRQRIIQHREVELDLWELDADYKEDDYSYKRGGSGGNRTKTNRNSRNRIDSSTGRGRSNLSHTGSGRRENSRRNLRLYEQESGGSKTRDGSFQREFQIQDIRRYRSAGPESNMAARSANKGSARPVQSIRRRRTKKRKIYAARALGVTLAALCLVLIYYMTGEIYRLVHHRNDAKGVINFTNEKNIDEEIDESTIDPPQIIENYLEVNDYSRPGTELKEVNSIFVHYTANSGTSAAQNRSYFANLPLTQERSASAHLIIGYDGEIIQCIPFDEQAYAVRTRNEDSVSIECCYTSEDGSFTQETYETLVHTLAWLIDKYDLSVDDILRHYDCGGKMCPIYYVEHEDAWERLLRDVEFYGTL